MADRASGDEKRPLLIALIISVVITGIGVPLTMVEFSSFKEVPIRQDFPELFQPQIIHLMETDDLDRVIYRLLLTRSFSGENPKLGYGSLQLILPPGEYEPRYNDQLNPPNYEYVKTVNIVAIHGSSDKFRTGAEDSSAGHAGRKNIYNGRRWHAIGPIDR